MLVCTTLAFSLPAARVFHGCMDISPSLVRVAILLKYGCLSASSGIRSKRGLYATYACVHSEALLPNNWTSSFLNLSTFTTPFLVFFTTCCKTCFLVRRHGGLSRLSMELDVVASSAALSLGSLLGTADSDPAVSDSDTETTSGEPSVASVMATSALLQEGGHVGSNSEGSSQNGKRKWPFAARFNGTSFIPCLVLLIVPFPISKLASIPSRTRLDKRKGVGPLTT